MRIVDRGTFMAMPAGTIYAKIPEPIVIRDLSVKADTIHDSTGRAIDWVKLELANWQSRDTGDWAGLFDVMLEHGQSVPLDDGFGRDGCFDDADKFLVFERADLLQLREYIDAALALLESPRPKLRETENG